MTPMLKVTEQGTERWVVGDTTPAPQTELARINPDAIVRDALAANASAVQSYMRTVASTGQRTIDAGARHPTGYSNDSELRQRNRRYFVTIFAYVAIAAAISAGVISLAVLADVVVDSWFWPSWLTLAGTIALLLVRWTHALESHLTPEGIAMVGAESEAYASERAADGQFLISQAISLAIAWKAEAEHADSAARLTATSAMYESMAPAPAPRRLTMAPTLADDGGMLTYATTVATPSQNAASAAQTPVQALQPPVWTVKPAQPDSGCLAMLAEVERLFADAQHSGDNLVTRRLMWSQRGEWPMPMKRKAIDVLRQLQPPLLLAGDGGRWRLNVAEWCAPLAAQAIRRRWR